MFDSAKARQTEEIAQLQKSKPKTQRPTQGKPTALKGESKWKRESEYFREAIRAAKMGISSGPAPVDPSLVPCPHCGRKFNEEAANRHIPICKNVFSKPKDSPKSKQPATPSSLKTGPKVSTKPESKRPLEKRATNQTLVECPHCGRHFEKYAAERHLPICSKVVNKPKKLNSTVGVKRNW